MIAPSASLPASSEIRGPRAARYIGTRLRGRKIEFGFSDGHDAAAEAHPLPSGKAANDSKRLLQRDRGLDAIDPVMVQPAPGSKAEYRPSTRGLVYRGNRCGRDRRIAGVWVCDRRSQANLGGVESR